MRILLSRRIRLGLTPSSAQAKGSTATQINFLKATMAALSKTYQVSTP